MLTRLKVISIKQPSSSGVCLPIMWWVRVHRTHPVIRKDLANVVCREWYNTPLQAKIFKQMIRRYQTTLWSNDNLPL